MAQLLPIVALPLLTRLYTPSDFGLVGVYSAVIAIASVAASGRYEHSILLAATDAESASAFRFALRLCLATSAAAAVVAMAGGDLLSRVVDAEKVQLLTVGLPLGIGLVGITQACTVWLLRTEQVALISWGRVAGAVTTVLVGVMAGLGGVGGSALVAAALLGQFVTAFVFWVAAFRGTRDLSHSVPAREIAAKFKRFPLFTVPADLSSAGAAQYPLLFLSGAYGVNVAGAFTLAQRVLGLPLSVVGSAVLDAYKRDASALYAATGDCRRLALRAVLALAAVALPAWLLVVLAAPQIFAWLFGGEWQQAGVMCQILASPLFLRFVMTPISYNFYLAGRQAEDLIAQAYNLLSTVVLLWTCAALELSANAAIAVYACNLTIVFTYYLLRSLMLGRRRPAPAA